MQDGPIFNSDFEKSEAGMSHLIDTPKRYALFLPEALVEEIPPGHILNLSPNELAAQIKAYKKIEESKIAEDDKASTDVSRAAVEGHSPSLLYQQLQAKSNPDMHHKMNQQPSQQNEKHRSSSLHHNIPADQYSLQAEEAEIEGVKRMSSQLQGEIRELNSALQVKEDAIQAKDSEIESVRRRSSQLQNEIRELNSALQFKEHAILAKDSEIESVRRRSSQLQSEIRDLNSTLQFKERAILAKDSEIENVKRRSSQLQSEIRNLSTALQDKEHIIQRNTAQIADLQEKVDAVEDTSQFTQLQSSIQSKADSWSIPRVQMQSISKREIGHGAWGVVYSSTFQGERVAIKIAHRDLLHATTIDMLKREVMIMANIQHPNLVRFVGAVFDDAVKEGRDMPIIVSELMDMNLRDACKKVNLSPSLISIFCDVAYALHYLHQHSQPIIHRDVSAPNVLLKSLQSGGYQAKVSDFGSANLVKQATTAGAGAIVYCAPEMFPNEDISVPPQPQTTKVDVFSYGVLMLEVVVKEMPTPSTRYAMLQQVKGKWTLMYELIVQCTKPLPCDRPAMADILNKLNRIPH